MRLFIPVCWTAVRSFWQPLTRSRSTRVNLILAAIVSSVLLGSAIAPTWAAPARGWVRVLTDDARNIWYLDKGTIKGAGRYRYFWLYVSLGNPIPIAADGRLLNSSAMYVSVDCQTLMYRPRYVQLLDQNTKVIDESDVAAQSTATKVFPSDKAGQAILKSACGRR
jgi:hypothetical protein